ncbi:CRE-MLTN-13 protein [Aphelenchoides avenae]|nr:CRE-MLTN-13 protein [Aphelenchus avenae]
MKRLKLRYRYAEAMRISALQQENMEQSQGRVKRSMPVACKSTRNIAALRKIHFYYTMTERVQTYMNRVKDHNKKFLKELDVPVDYKDRQSDISSTAKQVAEFLHDFDNGTLSILSPRLFNVFPSTEWHGGPHKMLSPTLLSFQEEGAFPLPRLFQLLSSNECDNLQWMDVIMELSGASRTLRDLVAKLEPEMKALREKTYPTILKLEKMERKWDRFKASHNPKQLKAMQTHGYTHMDPDQFEMLYGDGGHLGVSAAAYRRMTPEEREGLFEDDIRQIARIDRVLAKASKRRGRRWKRQARGVASFSLFRPYAFTNTIGTPVAFRTTVGSPHAFVTEILSPTALNNLHLTPRAFVATILSPYALVARTTSPWMFRMELLTPKILTAFIVSPTILTTNIMSPKLLETRVLSPDVLMLNVLNPSLGLHRFYSGTVGTIFVLSPSIMSTGFMSSDDLRVEVLSPKILSIAPKNPLDPLDLQNPNRRIVLKP